MAGYRQTRNSLPGMSQPRRKYTTTNRIYSWQFKYVNALLLVLCMSNGLICGYINSIHDKIIVTSCAMWHLPQKIRVLWLLCSILSANYFAMIYAADNSQLTILVCNMILTQQSSCIAKLQLMHPRKQLSLILYIHITLILLAIILTMNSDHWSLCACTYIAKTEVVTFYGYLLILFPSFLHLVGPIKLNLLGCFLLRILKEWLKFLKSFEVKFVDFDVPLC